MVGGGAPSLGYGQAAGALNPKEGPCGVHAALACAAVMGGAMRLIGQYQYQWSSGIIHSIGCGASYCKDEQEAAWHGQLGENP